MPEPTPPKICKECKLAPATEFVSPAGNKTHWGWCKDCLEREVRSPTSYRVTHRGPRRRTIDEREDIRATKYGVDR